MSNFFNHHHHFKGGGGHPRANSYIPETDSVILYQEKGQESRRRRFSKEFLIVCPPYSTWHSPAPFQFPHIFPQFVFPLQLLYIA